MDGLPPDPYLALGVAKDATAAAIKTQYRKLVLKCHPDKVEDSQKVEAADKFHKIQTAWEIVGNEARRQRYDKQCLLEQLRKETMAARQDVGRGGVDVRTAGYRMPTESARGGDFFASGPPRYAQRASPPSYEPQFEPQYEERRPAYAQEDYFDQQPRPTSRKYDDYERSSKRASPKDERPKAKTSSRDAKESERSSRKDKSRRTEKDIRRDRDRKTANVTVEEAESSSENEARERRARQFRAEQEAKLAREKLYEDVDRDREAADSGAYQHERASKSFREAAEYIARTRAATARMRPETVERRPSPPDRMASSKDKVEYLKRDGRPSAQVRRSSTSTKPTRYESRSGSDRERDEYDEARERSRRSGVRHVRPPPPLEKTASAPPGEIRPGMGERQRSATMQEDDYYSQPRAKPSMRRADTTPIPPVTAAPRDSRGRKESSKLRPQDAYATPEPTPEAEARTPRYPYGQQYADDMEYATPDGYRTEYREPSDRRIHHSPEPMEERSRERDRQRPASSKKTAAPQPPPLDRRTTSTKYTYPSVSRESSYSSSRPAVSREDSGRLFNEIRPSQSPRASSHAYAPPPEKVTTSRTISPDDVKYATGYSSRRSDRPERPYVERTYSRQGQVV